MNPIIEELQAIASLDYYNPEQKAYYQQRAADAKPVECMRMCDVFTPDQLDFLRDVYQPKHKQCYKNAAILVSLISHPLGGFLFPQPVKYVEGFAYPCGILPIEHAFVKYGDRYIDPTFERALHRDVRKEFYVSCIELLVEEMNQLQAETGYFGELYQYTYLKRFKPELAAKIRALAPQRKTAPERIRARRANTESDTM